MKTINELYTGWKTGAGIFSDLSTAGALPWGSTVTAAVLDFDYHGNNSGRKVVSCLLDNLTDETTGTISAADRATVAGIIRARFLQNWGKRWAVLLAEYDPIENYNSTETTNATDSGTDTNSNTTTSTTERAHDTTDTVTSSAESSATTNSTTASNVYGFNSTEAVPANTATGTDTNTGTNSGTVTTARDGSDTDTMNGTNSGTNTHNNTTTSTTTRKGNIGVTTSQTMITAELELRRYDYFLGVYNDIDSVLACGLYK